MIETKRLKLIPMTYSFISKVLDDEKTAYEEFGIKSHDEWPSNDIKEILPFLLKSLSPTSDPDGFGAWLFIDKMDDSIIGDGGFKGAPNDKGSIDIGYNIVKSKRRKGYAFEAVSALIKWGLSHPDVQQITADCLIENTPSINLLKKLGMMEASKDDEVVYFIMP